MISNQLSCIEPLQCLIINVTVVVIGFGCDPHMKLCSSIRGSGWQFYSKMVDCILHRSDS